MSEFTVTVSFFVAHFLLFALVLQYAKRKNYALFSYMLLFMLIMPVAGSLCIYGCIRQKSKAEPDFDDEDGLVFENERVIDGISDVKNLVAFSDALVMNKIPVRRKMMMEIINENPEDNLSLLRQAGKNEDTEVVHYAATMLSELSGKYDKELQSFAHTYAKDSFDEEFLKDYIIFYQKYLDKGMVSGEIEKIKRKEYSMILEKILSMKDISFYRCLLIENELELSHFDRALELIEKQEKLCPMDEESWLLRLRYYCKMGMMKEARALVSTIRKKKIYISAENKCYMSFFDQEDYSCA